MRILDFPILVLVGSILSLLNFNPVCQGQTRFLERLFPETKVDTGITYGTNASPYVFSYPALGFVPEELRLDLYQPLDDTMTLRPLVIYVHTGNLLPFKNPAIPQEYGFNGTCGGERSDSSGVEICSRLAQMGYVTASIDYRLGWNPLAPSDILRRLELLRACYKGMQDIRTAVRFFRKTAMVDNNPYRIDTNRIVIWGEGTGATLALAAASLDEWSKIPNASDGKFLWDHDQNSMTSEITMVDTLEFGDIHATSVGLHPETQDTTCYPNHTGFSSSFHLVVNMSGASLDTAWMDPGQPPILSFAVPNDIHIPYGESNFSVPHLQIVKMQGSYIIQHFSQELGLQTPFDDPGVSLALEQEQSTAFVHSPAGFQESAIGLYPFNVADAPNQPGIPLTSAPWEWTSFVPINSLVKCNNDGNIARAYIDTIIGFYAPRGCFALGLTSCIEHLTGIEVIPNEQVALQVFPNPATSFVQIRSEAGAPIREVQVYDELGRVVRVVPWTNSSVMTLERNGLATGRYVALIRFDEGAVVQKIIFD
ncbi:MAG: T9SS type A sorting domain-containing protein [Saprospiraceae bacterium]|nr:T9SS type A sorting domain-containing protein [Saprospiraceae bacterium]